MVELLTVNQKDSGSNPDCVGGYSLIGKIFVLHTEVIGSNPISSIQNV